MTVAPSYQLVRLEFDTDAGTYEVEAEVEPGDRGSRTTGPSGGEIRIKDVSGTFRDGEVLHRQYDPQTWLASLSEADRHLLFEMLATAAGDVDDADLRVDEDL